MIRVALVAAICFVFTAAGSQGAELLLDLQFQTRSLDRTFATTLQATVERDQHGDRLAVTASGTSSRFEIQLTFGSAPEADIEGVENRLHLAGRHHDHAIYRRAATELEWEIQLTAPPDNPTLTFPYTVSDIECLYQPSLSIADEAAGAERPDSVVGSYACYSQSTGAKLFHIYRPRAWDSRGDTVWCDLVIDPADRSFSITTPAAFLASAHYPVTIDPTFGFTSIGASTAPVAGTVCYGAKSDSHAASTGETVTQFHGYFRGVGEGSLDFALYTLVGGVPSQRLAAPVTMAIASSALAELNNSPSVSQALSGSQTYVIAFGNEVGDIRYAYDTQVDAASIHTSSAQLPTTWSEGVSSDRRLSIFVTYETGGTIERYPLRRRHTSLVE